MWIAIALPPVTVDAFLAGDGTLAFKLGTTGDALGSVPPPQAETATTTKSKTLRVKP